MANLPASGELRFSDLQAYSAPLTTGENSLGNMERRFMVGDAGTSNQQDAYDGICMPGQLEVSFNTANTTVGSGGRAYTGTTQPWRAARMSEFYRAHGQGGAQGQGKPQITSVDVTRTGNVNTGYAELNFDRGYWSSSAIWLLIKDNSGNVFSGWDQVNPPDIKSSKYTIAKDPVRYTGYIRDIQGCGLNLELHSPTFYYNGSDVVYT